MTERPDHSGPQDWVGNGHGYPPAGSVGPVPGAQRYSPGGTVVPVPGDQGYQPGQFGGGWPSAGWQGSNPQQAWNSSLGSPPPRRPALVTAAAVLAFISSGVAALVLLVAVMAIEESPNLLVATNAPYAVLTVAMLALQLTGGVLAIQGKSSRVLVATAAASIGLELVFWIIEFGEPTLESLVLPILMVCFLSARNSRWWFVQRGGKTFRPPSSLFGDDDPRYAGHR